MTVKLSDAFQNIGSDICQNLAATGGNIVDANANGMLSLERSTFSTLVATNHNYLGGGTPNVGTVTWNAATPAAMGLTSFSSTQYTPVGSAAACLVLVGIG